MSDTLFRLTIQIGENGPKQVNAYPGDRKDFEKVATAAIENVCRVEGLKVCRLEVDDLREIGTALDALRKKYPGLETGVARGRVNSWTRRGDLPTPSRSRTSGYQRAL